MTGRLAVLAPGFRCASTRQMGVRWRGRLLGPLLSVAELRPSLALCVYRRSYRRQIGLLVSMAVRRAFPSSKKRSGVRTP